MVIEQVEIKEENVCLDGCYGDYVSWKKISKTVGETGACPWTGRNNEEGARASDGQCLERTCPVSSLRPGSLSLQPISVQAWLLLAHVGTF